MKLSISLPDDDVELLDEYARTAGLRSRSAAVHEAIQMLRLPGLEDDYAAAWDEWESSGHEVDWSAALPDSVTDAAR